MPTVLRHGAFRIYFYSHEPNEPAHIHIDGASSSAKFWLHDAGLARNDGFSAPELGAMRRLVIEHRRTFLEAWNVHFG